MKTFTNSVKYRNPQTNDFETLPGLVGPGGGVHVGAKEPTNTNVNVWVTTEKENYYEIPEINDETISSEDTWSSTKIKGEIDTVNERINEEVEVINSTIDTTLSYSIGETLTGGTWIDGKPIYRFIWQGTTSLSGEQGVVCRLPEGHFDTVFTLRGMFKRTSDNNWFAIPNIYYGAISWAVNIRTDLSTDEPDGILLGFGSQYTGSRSIIIIAEYTKS